MKLVVTLFFAAGALFSGYSQTGSRTEAPRTGTGTNSRDLPPARIPAGFPFPIGGPQDENAPQPKAPTVQDYQVIIAQSDELYFKELYEEAIAGYSMALTLKDDPYPKDQIIRSKAEQDRARREQLQRDKDQAIRTEAEAAAYVYNSPGHYVHFSGALMTDRYTEQKSSKVLEDDRYSNILVPGKYDVIGNSLNKASYSTLDGILVPPGTRVIIYSEEKFNGTVVLDVTGPAIINNNRWEHDKRFMDVNTVTFIPELQALYPPSVRSWSTSDMHFWHLGSMEIIIL